MAKPLRDELVLFASTQGRRASQNHARIFPSICVFIFNDTPEGPAVTLDDFMQVTATDVTNAVNLSRFMVNLRPVSGPPPDGPPVQCARPPWCRDYKYVTELLKLLPEPPDEDSVAQLFHQVTQLGRIHPAEPHLTAA